MIDFVEADKLIEYCPETGKFFWKSHRYNDINIGDEVGYNCHGYRRAKINKKSVALHRLAFLLMYGKWPTLEVDHINGDKSDNRWLNLRLATRKTNMRNCRKRNDNKTGLAGIFLLKDPRDQTHVVAEYRDDNAKIKRKMFSLRKYGGFNALEMARLWRRDRLNEVGGYTGRHGL